MRAASYPEQLDSADRELVFMGPGQSQYCKSVVTRGRITGALAIGTGADTRQLQQAVQERSAPSSVAPLAAFRLTADLGSRLLLQPDRCRIAKHSQAFVMRWPEPDPANRGTHKGCLNPKYDVENIFLGGMSLGCLNGQPDAASRLRYKNAGAVRGCTDLWRTTRRPSSW